MTSTCAPVAPMIRPATAAADPFAQSTTIRSPAASHRAGEPLPVGEVAVDAVARVDDGARAAPARTRQLVRPPDERLELVLDRVVELQPGGVEDLEAVVLGRVVGCRDHDPGGVIAVRGQEREGRRRHDPDDVDRHAQLVAPAASAATSMSPERRVSWPTTIEPPGPDEPVRRRPPEGERRRRLEVDVGDPADAVGAEQAWHG